MTVCPLLNITGATTASFSQFFSFPIMLQNDANAACFAETWHNSQIKHCFYIDVGEYIGGAILIDHNVYMGEDYRSGEIGHTTLIPGGLNNLRTLFNCTIMLGGENCSIH